MQTPHQNPAIDESPEQWLSAFHDREMAELPLNVSTFEQISAERRDELQHAWRSLAESLRAIPVQPVVGLQQVIGEELRAERARRMAGSLVPVMRQTGGSSRSFRWFGVAVSMAAVALFSLRLGLHQQPGVEFIRPDPSIVAQFAQDLTTEPDWQIVVITLDEQSANITAEWLESTIRDQGLSAAHWSGSQLGHPQFPLGILVASDAESAVLVNSVTQRSHPSHLQWNPGYVGSVASSDVKRQFLHSMQTPTLSDEFFGQMYAVVRGPARRRPDASGADSQLVAARELPFQELSADVEPSAAAQPSGAGSVSRPVLVVFLQQPAGEQAAPVPPDQGQLMAPPASPAGAHTFRSPA